MVVAVSSSPTSKVLKAPASPGSPMHSITPPPVLLRFWTTFYINSSSNLLHQLLSLDLDRDLSQRLCISSSSSLICSLCVQLLYGGWVCCRNPTASTTWLYLHWVVISLTLSPSRLLLCPQIAPPNTSSCGPEHSREFGWFMNRNSSGSPSCVVGCPSIHIYARDF